MGYDLGTQIQLTAAGAGTSIKEINSGKSQRLNLTIDITVAGGTPTLTVFIEGKDGGSGKWYPILTSAALAAVATTVLRVGPGLTAAANLVANDQMPPVFRIRAVVGGTTPAVTARISAALI